MRITLDGTTQNLFTLIRGIDARWPHVNVHRLRLYFPTSAAPDSEAGNAGASCKVGDSGVTTTNVGVETILAEGKEFFRLTEGQALNLISLKSVYVRGSAASTVLFVEATVR